ncbi:Lar family restriction alleviation protein [Methanospirillum lacunae]|uniref:Restriction endonuclease n=1 Tax=Methanospirillum lacunae TaxID=668570 RepID=A0A2V2ND81_9EURY|nr:hypothetical protein DK846_04045 [Methanospirillum lacunae]
MTESYKPCPFCGSNYVKIKPDDDYNHVWTIHCPRCHMVYIPYGKTREEIILKWNQRV